MTPPTVGLALIARDEEHNLPHLLASIQDSFDRIALLDTGSTDRTQAVFEEWCQSQVGLEWSVGSMEWTGDFAQARVRADELLGDVDWRSWADADDVIEGAQNLRALAAQAPPDLAAYVMGYRYAHDPHGNCVCYLRRERLVRRGRGRWEGRVHEAQQIDGRVSVVHPELCEWVHRKDFQHTGPQSNQRNLTILEAWGEDEPGNPRVRAYLGTELAAAGRHGEAVAHFDAYLALPTGWDEERAQVARKLSGCLIHTGDIPRAERVALDALRGLPSWPDSYLTLAECALSENRYHHTLDWARRVLDLGQPDTLLIVNPLDYTFQPRVLLAAAHAGMGQVDEAIGMADEALGMVPAHPQLLGYYRRWKQTAKREHTADTIVGMAELLVAHDEQLKALDLLERSVPHYCMDHEKVVTLRSHLRERVRPLLEPAGQAEHYETATEVGIPDLSIVEHLPRAQFLARGLAEQAEVVA